MKNLADNFAYNEESKQFTDEDGNNHDVSNGLVEFLESKYSKAQVTLIKSRLEPVA